MKIQSNELRSAALESFATTPFPDGNKRLGYECMREMLERSGVYWPRPSEDAEEIALKVNGLAAGTVSEQEFVGWVRQRTEAS